MSDPNLPPGYQPPAYQSSGQQQNPQYGYQQPGAPARYNVLAIVSLVSSFFISLVAIITGHMALSQIKRTGEQGRGLAIAGLVLGYLGLFAGIIIFFLILVPTLIAISEGTITTN